MKRSVLPTAMLLAACLGAQGQLTLGPGDSYTNQFKTLFRTGRSQVAFPPVALVTVAVDPATLQNEDALRVQMFENLPAGTPFYEQTLTSTTNPMLSFAAYPAFSLWEDLQGSVRITMVSGSVTMHSLSVSIWLPEGGSAVSEFASTIPLPEGRPSLRAVRSATALDFRWPTTAINYTLETTTSLPAANGWQSVTNAVEVIGDTFRVNVPLDLQVQSGFYRLRQVP